MVDGGQGLSERVRCRWGVGSEQRSEQALVELAVEDRDSLSLGGQDVGVAGVEAFDEPVESQSPEFGTAQGSVDRVNKSLGSPKDGVGWNYAGVRRGKVHLVSRAQAELPFAMDLIAGNDYGRPHPPR